MYLVLLFTAAAIMGASGRSANVHKHMKTLKDIDNKIEGHEIRKSFRNFLKISEEPNAIYAHEPGTTLSLTCAAVGSPAPSVHWFKNDVPVFEFDQESTELIDSTPTSLGDISSTLLVTRSVAGARDVYTCLATAGAKIKRATTVVYGKGTNTDVSERARLFPLAPRIVVFFKVFIDIAGTNVVLPCRVKGHPRPIITWTDNNEKPVTENPKMKVLRSGELVIKDVQWEDMGEFTCHATNAFGSTSESTFLYPAKPSKKNE